MLRISSAAAVVFLQVFCTAIALQSSWEYEFLETYVNNSDTERVLVEMEMERISRGVYGLTGVLLFKEALTDEYMIYVDAYRSTSGTGDWKKLPYAVPKQTVTKFFQTTYRNIAMDSLKDCSNLPQLDKDWQGPFEAGKYDVNKCILKKDKLPNYLPDGYYKVYIVLDGPANSLLHFLVKVQNSF